MNPLFKKLPVFIAFLVCILMTIIMSMHGRVLQTRFSALGIISLELAHTEKQAVLIKNVWSKTNSGNQIILKHALENTLLDFIYIGCYGFFLIVFSLRSSMVLPEKKLMKTTAILVFIAGGMDMIENFCLFYSLQKQVLPLITLITASAASLKFMLLAMVILLLLICWGKFFFKKRNGYN